MGLFRNKTKQKRKGKSQSVLDNFSPEQRELYFKFDDKYYDKFHEMVDEFEALCEDIEDLDGSDRKKQCEKALKAFNKLENFCSNKGVGGDIFLLEWLSECNYNEDYIKFADIDVLMAELDYLNKRKGD